MTKNLLIQVYSSNTILNMVFEWIDILFDLNAGYFRGLQRSTYQNFLVKCSISDLNHLLDYFF